MPESRSLEVPLNPGEERAIRDYKRIAGIRARGLRDALIAQFSEEFVSPADYAPPGESTLRFLPETAEKYYCLPIDDENPDLVQVLIAGSMDLESQASAQTSPPGEVRKDKMPTYRMSLARTGDPSVDVLLYSPAGKLVYGYPRTMAEVSVLYFIKDSQGRPQPKLYHYDDGGIYNIGNPMGLVALIPKPAPRA